MLSEGEKTPGEDAKKAISLDGEKASEADTNNATSSNGEKTPQADDNNTDQPNNQNIPEAADLEIAQQGKLERVPRSQRRGLLASCLIVPEVTNPYQYGNATKWLMTGIVALAATTSSAGSSIFYRKLLKNNN